MRNVIYDIEQILEELKFKPSDIKIYSLLLEKGGLTVNEIAKELNMSSRFVRERLKRLYNDGIVKKKLVKRGWVGYVYEAENPVKVFTNLRNKIIEKLQAIEKQLMEE